MEQLPPLHQKPTQHLLHMNVMDTTSTRLAWQNEHALHVDIEHSKAPDDALTPNSMLLKTDKKSGTPQNELTNQKLPETNKKKLSDVITMHSKEL